MKIGSIGLGTMGCLMAKNLVKAGHELYADDFHKGAVDDLVAQGATAVANAREAALASELIITMLPNSPHAKTVALGENGIAEGMHEGLVYVDMSSIAPLVSHEVHDELVKVGIPMPDVPVSGGESKAIDDTLAATVGGNGTVFEQVTPVLDVTAGSVAYVDAIGAGNTAKLASQTIVVVNIAACTEAFMLAQRVGMDPEVVFQAIRGGLAGSTVMDAKVPMMLARNFTPGFRINLYIKDPNSVPDTGHGVNSPLPLTAAVRDMVSVLQGDDFDTDNHSGLLKYYEKLSDTELRPGEPEE